jgi:hypothetical protein
MLTTTKWITALTLMTGLIVAGGLGSSTFAQQQFDPDARDRDATQPRTGVMAEDQDVQVETLQGRIVDVRAFLTGAQDADMDAGLERQELWSNGDAEQPIALVSERGFIGQMFQGHRVHLLIHNPERPEAKEAYDKARSLIGQHVQLTGKVYDRDGLKAVSVQAVEIAIPEAAAEGQDAQQQPWQDSQQDDRTY